VELPEVVEPQAISPITGLTKNQLKAAQMLSLGFAPRVVASKVGVALTTISNWRKLKPFTDAVKFLQDGGADKVIAEMEDLKSAEEILETASTRAAEVTTEIMETADSDQTRLRAAEGVLDRTGRHRKTEVHKHIVLIEASAVDLIEQTKSALIPEADFTLEEEDGEGEPESNDRERVVRDDERGTVGLDSDDKREPDTPSTEG
jgi:enoyl-CoA hydratase/carnithine racemase